MLRGGPAEGAGILSARQPGKRSHSALRWNPAEYIVVVCHEALKELEVLVGGFLGFAEHDITFTDCDLSKSFSGGGVRDREVGSRGPVLLAALDIVLDHPSRTHARNRKRFREIRDYGGVRQTRRRFRLPSVVDGMVDLVTHQLDPAFGGEVVQSFHFAIADGRARGVVRAVEQNELGLRVGEPLDLIGVNAEAVFAAHAIEAGFQTKRLRERGESSEARQGDDDVRAGLSGQPHQGHDRLRRAGYDLHGLNRDMLHCSYRLTQTVGAGGVTVRQLVIQEAMARFVIGEGKDVVYGPGGPGARSQVEFYVVFVLVEPDIEQEGLELHASTSMRK